MANGRLRRAVSGLICIGFAVLPCLSGAFSFSEEDAKNDQGDAAVALRIQQLVSEPCRQTLKNQKIMTLMAERRGDGYDTVQDRYGQLFAAINARLRGLGLHTYSQAEIKAQIAQAEIDAYFKNDPDAALAASRRLGANYILRGDITTTTGVNPVLHINEVSVRMAFRLSTSGGRLLSDVSAKGESYAGSDTLGMAVTLVNEQADMIVAQLYNDYCHKAGSGH
jgi:hypothetical protein